MAPGPRLSPPCLPSNFLFALAVGPAHTMAAQGKSALTAALAGGGDASDPPPTARLRLDPKAFPCLAGVAAGGVGPPLVAGADGLGELVSGFEQVSLRGNQLAGSAPTAGLLSDGSAAVSEKKGGREGVLVAAAWKKRHC